MKQSLRLRAAQAENLPEALDADAVRELAEDTLAMLDLIENSLCAYSHSSPRDPCPCETCAARDELLGVKDGGIDTP